MRSIAEYQEHIDDEDATAVLYEAGSTLHSRRGPQVHFKLEGSSASGQALLTAALTPSGDSLFEANMTHVTHKVRSARLNGEEKGFVGRPRCAYLCGS